MTLFRSAQDRDANYRTVAHFDAFRLESSWTFAAGTTGATGAHTLFDVTGRVALNIFAICTSDLTSGGAATVEVGTASGTAAMADQVTATTIDNHEVYSESVLAVAGVVAGHTHPVNEDVILTIGTTTVTGGTLVFYCTWRPLSDDGLVTVRTPA